MCWAAGSPGAGLSHPRTLWPEGSTMGCSCVICISCLSVSCLSCLLSLVSCLCLLSLVSLSLDSAVSLSLPCLVSCPCCLSCLCVCLLSFVSPSLVSVSCPCCLSCLLSPVSCLSSLCLLSLLSLFPCLVLSLVPCPCCLSCLLSLVSCLLSLCLSSLSLVSCRSVSCLCCVYVSSPPLCLCLICVVLCFCYSCKPQATRSLQALAPSIGSKQHENVMSLGSLGCWQKPPSRQQPFFKGFCVGFGGHANNKAVVRLVPPSGTPPGVFIGSAWGAEHVL